MSNKGKIITTKKPPIEFVRFYRYIEEISQKYDFIDYDTYKSKFDKYIRKLKEYHKLWFPGKGFYNVEHVAEQLFRREIEKKQGKMWVKIELQALIMASERLSEEILKKSIQASSSRILSEEPDFLDLLRLLKEFAFETIPFIDFAHYYINGKFADWGWGKRNVMHSQEIYRASQNLLIKRMLRNMGDFIIQPTSIVLLRQAIEIRLKNAFGIDRIVDKKGKAIKIPGIILVDLIEKNINSIEFPIKISILKKIYNWTQYYVHGGFAPYIWEMEWAHYLLSGLFASGEYGNHYSLFGSIKIDKIFYDKIDIELEKFLMARKRKKFIKINFTIISDFINTLLNRKKTKEFEVFRMQAPESIIKESK